MSNNTRKLLWFGISKMLIVTIYCVIYYNFRHTFVPCTSRMTHRPALPWLQVWVLWLLESPVNTPKFRHAERLINWTATYRPDSTIVTPYDKFVAFAGGPRRDRRRDPAVPPAAGKWPYPPSPSRPRPSGVVNHAAGKSRLVAWSWRAVRTASR